LAEHRVVASVAVGSSPTTLPTPDNIRTEILGVLQLCFPSVLGNENP
jgi:hypothetical protein